MRVYSFILVLSCVAFCACQPQTLQVDTPEWTGDIALAAFVSDGVVLEIEGPFTPGEVLIQRAHDLKTELFLLELNETDLISSSAYPAVADPREVRVGQINPMCEAQYNLEGTTVEIQAPVCKGWRLDSEGERFLADPAGLELGKQISLTLPLTPCPGLPALSGANALELMGTLELREEPPERVRGLDLYQDAAVIVTHRRIIVLDPAGPMSGEWWVENEGWSIGGFDSATRPTIGMHRAAGEVFQGVIMQPTITATTVGPGPILYETTEPLGDFGLRPGGGLVLIERPDKVVRVDAQGELTRYTAGVMGSLTSAVRGALLDGLEPMAGTSEGEILELIDGQLIRRQLLFFEVPYSSTIEDLFSVAGRSFVNTTQGRLFTASPGDRDWSFIDPPLAPEAGECIQGTNDICGDPGSIGKNTAFAARLLPSPLFFLTSAACGVSFLHDPITNCSSPLALSFEGEKIIPDDVSFTERGLLVVAGDRVFKVALDVP